MPTRNKRMRGAAILRHGSWLASSAGVLALTTLAAQAQAPGAPPVATTEAEAARIALGRPVEPSVFGTIALPAGTTPTSARWTRLLAANYEYPALSRLIGGAEKLSREQQAAFVQSAVNRATQPGDTSGCRADDGYWATAQETLARGMGDCVDIAVAKVEALRRLGFAAQDLYLTTGRLPGRGQRAALLVRIGNQFWLLDDRSERMITAEATGRFDPALTYGVGMTWAHGRRLASTVPVN